jgi:CheY-like chemotaxis protein
LRSGPSGYTVLALNPNAPADSFMPAPLRFLVVDEDNDSRFLLEKTLLRKFPGAVVQGCRTADAALATARTDHLAAIVTHRTSEMAGADLVREFRAINAEVPIIMVSSIDRREAAATAGATCFLLYDEWLRIGSLVEELLQKGPPSPRSFQRN